MKIKQLLCMEKILLYIHTNYILFSIKKYQISFKLSSIFEQFIFEIF